MPIKKPEERNPMTNPKTVTEFLESEQDYFAMTIGDIHDYRRLLVVFDLARLSVRLREAKEHAEFAEIVKDYQKTISKIEGEL